MLDPLSQIVQRNSRDVDSDLSKVPPEHRVTTPEIVAGVTPGLPRRPCGDAHSDHKAASWARDAAL
jgi:hypothetical protein